MPLIRLAGALITVPLICQAHSLPLPMAEYRFCQRLWRFDWAWLDRWLALEIEGGVWTQGRHTRGAGVLSDMAKYNEAALLGWTVIRGTPQDVQTGSIVALLRRALL